MMKQLKLLFIFAMICFMGHAQEKHIIVGSFSQAKKVELELIGYYGLKDSLIAKTKTDDLGHFTLSYPAEYIGAGTLKINFKESPEQSNNLIVLLNMENFSIHCSDLSDLTTLKFENSLENDALIKGMVTYQESEAILAGLNYLVPLYAKSPRELEWLKKEKKQKERIFADLLKRMPSTSYARYYLFIRKFIADIPVTATRYIERLPETEEQFKKIDFADIRLQRSGLFKQLMDEYYHLLESHIDENVVAKHDNEATAVLLESLKGNAILKQEVAVYLFELLEKRSLFKAAEYLALQMLNDDSCSLDKKSTGLYEQYRKMGVGQQAPTMQLTTTAKGISTLANITASYKLIVFGSSWCPKCQEEVVQLKKGYQNLKNRYNLEVVFVSLDTDAVKYNDFINDFPWISSCDFKGWETQSAKDYFVFATPTMYLLDSNNKIILKPFSSAHVDSWLLSNGLEK